MARATPMPVPRAKRTGLRSRFSLGVLVVFVTLLSVGFLIADHLQLRDPSVDSAATAGNALVAAVNASENTQGAEMEPKPTLGYDPLRDGDLLLDFECVGWRHTRDDSPDGPREPHLDKDCSAKISGCEAGYCEYRHRANGALRRVMRMYPRSLHCHISFECRQAAAFMTYGATALTYVHDVGFSLDRNQAEGRAIASEAWALSEDDTLTFERGIAIVVYDKVLGSVYASIRSLRVLGTRLPIEVWYRVDELQASHPVLKALVAKYGVFLREIQDPRATTYYAKLHAVFYSAFDNVLFLDADDFAVKDPTYLFDTPEYKETGAMFWPDYWRSAHTIFHMNERSVLWEILGIPFVDKFEQESGQLLIDRRRHQKALNVLMYYGFTMPRILESLELVWGDKDLFRFAWMKCESSFHYIETLPGSVGKYRGPSTQSEYCGLSMVQHDPKGEIVFFHRSALKLRTDQPNQAVWTTIQQFKQGSPLDKYTMVKNKFFEDLEKCWALRDEDRDFFIMTPIVTLPLREVEPKLLAFADEAAAMMPEMQAPTKTLRG